MRLTVPNKPNNLSFCSNEHVGLISQAWIIGMLEHCRGAGKKGGVTPTSLTRQCCPQSHTDHQTRLPNSTNETKKFPSLACV